MAQKDINANVILNGKVGSGFSQMANKIHSLAQELQELNGWATELVGDSVKVYQSYSMA